jgi:AraC family transcriptional regulator, transcriptional activator of the genes for pyochelin and ferripyochelin receptors
MRKIVITAADEQFWEKLKLIQQLDPTIRGGLERVVLGHREQGRGSPYRALFRSGFEEVHEIEPGFCVHITDAVIDEDWRITARSDECTLRFRIVFAGEADFEARGAHLLDESARCTYIIRPAGDSLTAIFRGRATYRYISLSMSQHYLTDTLRLAPADMPSMLATHWARAETAMGHFLVSRTSLAQAARFFNTRLSPAWHDVMVRTLALDLLRMLFHDWQNSRETSRAMMRITPGERATLLKARDLVAHDPAAPLTLSGLSRRLKMNRNKLHAGFKQQFGLSVHAYQTELRMQEAFRLLRTSELPIAEIAQRTGFDEPTNFTAAFKRHYAVLPRDVRAGAAGRGEPRTRQRGSGRR